ncbi:MAG: hypothetical protein CM15mV29_1020 [uncultured marine virus]|nr:MAG: hypothetical protein CM15mV29_1020 [uncultured marine virus]
MSAGAIGNSVKNPLLGFELHGNQKSSKKADAEVEAVVEEEVKEKL